jgi:hypothetical protein
VKAVEARAALAKGVERAAVSQLKLPGGPTLFDKSVDYADRVLPQFIKDWVEKRRATLIADKVPIEPWFGNCSELGCIAQALASRPDVDTIENAKEFFRGALIQSANVRKAVGPNANAGSKRTQKLLEEHGKYKEPCDQTCDKLLEELGIL